MNDARDNMMKAADAGMAALCAAAVLMLGAGISHAATGTVSLRNHAEVPGDVVHLGDVAHLTGDYAKQYETLEVATLGGGEDRMKMNLSTIRAKLEEQGVNWGKLTCRGPMQMEVVRASGAKGDADGPAQGQSVEQTLANPMEAVSVAGIANGVSGGTLGEQLAAWIIGSLGLSADRVKLTWQDSDREVLAKMDGGGRFTFAAGGTALVGRTPWTVRLMEGEKVVMTERIMVTVEVRTEVVVAMRTLMRGETVTSADVREESRWVDSGLDRGIEKAQNVVGQVVTRTIREGEAVGKDDVSEPLLVKRGQLVTVRCISGALMLKTIGRAASDGAMGDLVEVKNERTRETFTMRVSGNQEGVMVVGIPAAAATTENEDHG